MSTATKTPLRPAKKIAETSEFNLVLMTEDAGVMKAGIEACGFKRPLMYAATEGNVDAYGALAKDNDLPLAVKADSVEGLIPLTEKLTGMGLKDLVIDPGSGRSNRPSKTRWHSGGRPSKTATVRWVSRPSPFPARWPPTWIWKHSLPACLSPSTAALWFCPIFTGESLVPAAARTSQYLHRSAAANDRDRGYLRDRQPG